MHIFHSWRWYRTKVGINLDGIILKIMYKECSICNKRTGYKLWQQ